MILSVVFNICLAVVLCHHIWQIKKINAQLQFINSHETNMIVTGDGNNGCIADLTRNINLILKKCTQLQSECITNENGMREAITGISHDIRTPLTSLSGYFQLLCQTDDAGKQKVYSKVIHQQIRALDALLEELFTYAKLLNQSYVLEMGVCCVTQILQEVLFGFYHQLKVKGIEPEIDLPDEKIQVVGNEVALHRVFQNVIRNVLEHGDNSLKVSLKRKADTIEIDISNSISSDAGIDMDKIFTRFYKSEMAGNTASTGLGLSIAKELLSKMNGRIGAEMEENIFSIKIYLGISGQETKKHNK